MPVRWLSAPVRWPVQWPVQWLALVPEPEQLPEPGWQPERRQWPGLYWPAVEESRFAPDPCSPAARVRAFRLADSPHWVRSCDSRL